ncbi:MAG: SsrA-binding protein SmpB [Planctomycetes bacterium]|nr:SsrA-binding protein SmpB [Planctomycetota bacterium]
MAKDAKHAAAQSPGLTNRKAFHEFEILERFVCGIVLAGPEVKSLRLGRASLDEAYARLKNGEMWIVKMHVDEYRDRGQVKLEPARTRKLLLSKHEIAVIGEALERQGLTLVPLKLFWNERGIAKIEIALARGKKLHDKRESEKAKTAKRDMARVMRRF